jgi:DNA repair photolyase
LKPLLDYITALENILKEQAKKFKDSGKIICQVELSSSANPKISITYNGEISQELLQSFYDEAIKLSLKTKTKIPKFQVLFDVKA